MYFPQTSTRVVMSYTANCSYILVKNFLLTIFHHKGSKNNLFYTMSLSSPIFADSENMAVFVKFKNSPGPVFLVHLLYSDGTLSNVRYENSVYMNSLDWALSVNMLETGKIITGFRIGLSNINDLQTCDMNAEIDFLGISDYDDYYSDYNPALLSLSSVGINYTVTPHINSLNSSNLRNIVVVDEDNYSSKTFNELLELVKKGSNMIVLGGFSKTGIASILGNITANNIISVNQVHFSSLSYDIPEITLSAISLSNSVILASYSDGFSSVPLLVKYDTAHLGSIYYFNLFPLITAISAYDTSLCTNIKNIANLVYTDLLHLSHITLEDRLFYLKNAGSFIVEGKFKMVVSDLIGLSNNINWRT